MKLRLDFVCLLVAAVVFIARPACAQDSIDALKQELQEAKQQHQDATTQVTSTFFSSVDAGMGDPGAAVNLYKTAGGPMPQPTPVTTKNIDESASERDAREAADQANLNHLGVVIQLQCGLMHYAALFVTDGKRAGLQGEWLDWLKKAAQIYPQLAIQPVAAAPTPDQQQDDRKRKRDSANGGNGNGGNGGNGNGGGNQTPVPPGGVTPDPKTVAVRDTVITKYLGFTGWGNKEQAGWTVQDIPKLYKAGILDPSRTPTPTADTMSYWNVYIAMLNADEPDSTHWNTEVYPPLQFEAATDDYKTEPSTEKLEALVNIIKANPNNEHDDEWIAQVGKLMDEYKQRHSGASSDTMSNPSTPAPTADPNVVVTTQQDGDATIVTTHTNTPPVNPPAPQ